MVITRAKKKATEPVSRITKVKKKPAETGSARPAKKPVAAAPAKDVEKRAEEFIDSVEAPPAAPLAEAAVAQPLPAAQAGKADQTSREREALAIVKQYVPWTAGAAIVPIPGLDLAAIIGVQMKMLSKLSQHYGVPFKENAAKSAAASLMTILLQGTLAGGLITLTRMIPVVGAVATVAALPAFAAAGTYAIGKVFITHFESGGTFLDFEPKKVEAHFRAEFEQARKLAA